MLTDEEILENNRRRGKKFRAEVARQKEIWTLARCTMADDFIKAGGVYARCAAEEGWIMRLHDFCREHARLPEAHEVQRVRAKSLASQRRVAEMTANGASKYAKPLLDAYRRRKERLNSLVGLACC